MLFRSLFDQLGVVDSIARTIVVTNGLFHDQFKEWSQCTCCLGVEILNDGTRSNDERLGAIGDMRFAIEAASLAGEDLLVAGADNIFRFPVRMLVEFFDERGADAISIVREPDPERLKRTSTLLLDDEDRIVDFAEKAPEPLSDMVCPPLYAFKADTLPLISEYLDAGHDPDAPGNFIAWLYQQKPVYGKLMPQGRHDIGSPESYREAQDAMED